MVVDAARDADTAGLGQPLETHGDIDAIAEDVAVLDHDIADIDADAKPHTALFAEGQVGLGKITLDLNGALYGGKYAGEFGENAVTGRAADPAAVLRDDRVGDGSMGRERRQRVFLGDAHQAAIPLDIGGEDGDELSRGGASMSVDLPKMADRIDRVPSTYRVGLSRP